MDDKPEHPSADEPVGKQQYNERLLHYLRHSWRIWLLGLIVVGGASSIFIKLAGEVWEQERLAWDVPIMLAVHQLSTPWLDTLMIGVTWIGFPGAIAVTAVGAIWFWWRGWRAVAIALLASVIGSSLLNMWLKLLFARPRPSVFTPLIAETTYSFPSGHTMGAVSLYGFAAYLLWRQGQRVWAVGALLFGLLIAFSRIYLGVHYPSDVIGALAVGVVWLAVVAAGYRYYRDWYSPARTEETGTLPAEDESPA